MAIAVKAVFNYSATTATTGAWSLTASTSIAAGDTLLLHAGYTSSASGSAGVPTDNAGNVWTLIGHSYANNGGVAAWWAPVTTTTANFQISFTAGGKTVSARAAHVIVLSGAHATEAIDLGSFKAHALGSGAQTTATGSTSATTTLDAGMLFVTMRMNAVASVTANAETGWGVVGTDIEVDGANDVSLFSWNKTISAQAIYKFSASLSIGGSNRSEQYLIYAVRSAAAGTVTGSGDTSIVFGQAAAITGAAAARAGSTALVFGQAAAATGAAQSLSGAAGVSFGQAAAISGAANDLGGGTVVAFNAVATATGVTAPTTTTTQSQTQYGWTPHEFRKLLEARRRELLERSRRALRAARQQGETDTASASIALAPAAPVYDPETARAMSAVAHRLLAMSIASGRQAWKLKEQEVQIAALQRQVEEVLARVEDDEDDDLLLMVA